MCQVFSLREQHRWRFSAILRSYGAESTTASDALFAEIVQRYNEPHRGHHNNQHVSEVHALLDMSHEEVSNPDALFVATEFHDVVYQAGIELNAGANESASAAWARDRLSALGVEAELIEAVERLVLSTSGTNSGPRSADEEILHDADYWVIGSPPERYWKYARGIAKEYQADKFLEAYKAGRAEFLQRTLSSGAVFLTPFFELAWGAQARSNMLWELCSLAQPMLDRESFD